MHWSQKDTIPSITNLASLRGEKSFESQFPLGKLELVSVIVKINKVNQIYKILKNKCHVISIL